MGEWASGQCQQKDGVLETKKFQNRRGIDEAERYFELRKLKIWQYLKRIKILVRRGLRELKNSLDTS